jgi:hypothetical protein
MKTTKNPLFFHKLLQSPLFFHGRQSLFFFLKLHLWTTPTTIGTLVDYDPQTACSGRGENVNTAGLLLFVMMSGSFLAELMT